MESNRAHTPRREYPTAWVATSSNVLTSGRGRMGLQELQRGSEPGAAASLAEHAPCHPPPPPRECAQPPSCLARRGAVRPGYANSSGVGAAAPYALASLGALADARGRYGTATAAEMELLDFKVRVSRALCSCSPPLPPPAEALA